VAFYIIFYIILSIEVTDEKTGDPEVFEDLVEGLNLEDCLGDGGYDSEKVFKLLEEKGVGPPGLKLRKNARGASRREVKPPKNSKN